MKKLTGIFCVVVLSLTPGCKQKKDNPIIVTPSAIAKGADISWLTEMEDANVKFFNSAGVEQECMQILKDKGINSIRIRAWVDPVDGWNNTADVVIKAVRAKNLGMKIMIDFHYSDTWADPGHQEKPADWSTLDFATLKSTLRDYTIGVMDTLIAHGVTPEWVQIGNETNDGMLWETGRASVNMANFAALVKSGYDAVKTSSDSTKVIVHISNGHDNDLFRWIFDGLKNNGATWDITGMSLYPSYTSGGVGDWANVNLQCLANMNDLISRYGKPVMLVEVGMPVNDPATCKAFLADLIVKTRSAANGQGLGVFYWEPECYDNWNGYGLGAFDNSGKPTIAMDAFLE